MNEHSAFDHKRDDRLGDVLRAALSVPGEDVFIRRVLVRVTEPLTWWEVLGGWARPGLAAALLLVAAAGFWLGRTVRAGEPTVALEEMLNASAGNGTMTALLSSARPPNVDVLFAATNGNE